MTLSPQIFQISISHLQILGTRMLPWSQFQTEYPKLWCNLQTSLLSGAFCSVYVNWYPFLYMGEGGNWINPYENIMHSCAYFSCPGFVYPWFGDYSTLIILFLFSVFMFSWQTLWQVYVNTSQHSGTVPYVLIYKNFTFSITQCKYVFHTVSQLTVIVCLKTLSSRYLSWQYSVYCEVGTKILKHFLHELKWFRGLIQHNKAQTST